jgi:hypothetical protein
VLLADDNLEQVHYKLYVVLTDAASQGGHPDTKTEVSHQHYGCILQR